MIVLFKSSTMLAMAISLTTVNLMMIEWSTATPRPSVHKTSFTIFHNYHQPSKLKSSVSGSKLSVPSTTSATATMARSRHSRKHSLFLNSNHNNIRHIVGNTNKFRQSNRGKITMNAEKPFDPMNSADRIGWIDLGASSNLPEHMIPPWSKKVGPGYVPVNKNKYPNVPWFDVDKYDNIWTKTKSGSYDYAIGLERTYLDIQDEIYNSKAYEKGTEHAVADEGNLMPIVDMPGSLKYNNRNHKLSDDQIKLYQTISYFGNSGELACQSMIQLLATDGAEFIKEPLPDSEFENPSSHIFAVIIPERHPDHPGVDTDGIYVPDFFRLNQEGIWSTKEELSAPHQVPVAYPRNVAKYESAPAMIVHLSYDGLYETRFCGFFRVTDQMKKRINEDYN